MNSSPRKYDRRKKADRDEIAREAATIDTAAIEEMLTPDVKLTHDEALELIERSAELLKNGEIDDDEYETLTAPARKMLA